MTANTDNDLRVETNRDQHGNLMLTVTAGETLWGRATVYQYGAQMYAASVQDVGWTGVYRTQAKAAKAAVEMITEPLQRGGGQIDPDDPWLARADNRLLAEAAGLVKPVEPNCSLEREGWRTTRWPGTTDQCPGCGRIVYTRADGTCRPHKKPKFYRGAREV